VLPAKFPNLLVNGAGIAVGMATNIPPHISAKYRRLRGADRQSGADHRRPHQHRAGAGFPTGGIILGRRASARPILGRGSIVMRGKVTIDTIRKDREAIIVTEIPSR
jgi:DNA gyrase subunit A